MWGVFAVFRAGRGAWRWYQKSHQKDMAARKAEGTGPWTPYTVVFLVAPAVVLGALVFTYKGYSDAWAWWLASAVLVAVPLAGAAARSAGQQRVLDRYASPPRQRDEAALMRERAELLTELEEQRQIMQQRTEPLSLAQADTEPLPAVQARDDLTERLFAQPCPVPVCLAQPPDACPMGVGIPVALVNRNPVEFCHLDRIAAGVAAGTASEEEVSGRFELLAVQ
jgi:hypothetical protein